MQHSRQESNKIENSDNSQFYCLKAFENGYFYGTF